MRNLIALDPSAGASIRQNTTTDYIFISEDKAELILRNHEDALGHQKAWVTPFTLGLSLIATFVTTDFKSFLNISGETWKLGFIVLFIVTCFWFVKTIYQLIRYGRNITVANIIKNFKAIESANSTDSTDSTS